MRQDYTLGLEAGEGCRQPLETEKEKVPDSPQMLQREPDLLTPLHLGETGFGLLTLKIVRKQISVLKLLNLG